MDRIGQAGERSDWLWVLGWALASSVWCLTAARELGPTADEPFYLRAGLECWHAHWHKPLLLAGTMPLPSELATLPLYLAEKCSWVRLNLDENLDAWLPLARAGTLPFWWLLLGSGYWAGRLWGGSAAGRLAVALLAVEPILLGHASLATTDLAVSACLLTLAVSFAAGREAPWARRVALPALCAAGTLLAKASGLVFVPVCLAVLELERLARAGRWRMPDGMEGGRTRFRAAGRSLLDLGQILFLGAVLLFALCPRAMHAFRFQVHHNLDGHPTPVYLLGAANRDGFWYYFPCALLLKLALPVLVFSALLLLRPRKLANGPFLVAAALMALSPFYHVQLGVRFVLPAAVLGLVGVAVALTRWQQECRSLIARRLVGAVVAASVLWTLGSALAVWPHGLCYTNELGGGTARGYLVLGDSNYDWGQGLRELAEWQRSHAAAPLDVWYFGNDPLLSRLPMRRVEPALLRGPGELLTWERGRYLAAGTSQLYGAGFHSAAAAYLRAQTPVARTRTFLIYDFRHIPEAGRPGTQ